MAVNGFAAELQKLLRITNTKSATLAKAVQYDLSYISKWLSGKMLPSEKNIDEVIQNIIICICENGEDKLQTEYKCAGNKLKECLSVELRKEYDKSRPKEKTSSFQGAKPISEVVQAIERRVGEVSTVTAVIDILSMPHESRLLMAGIKEGRFSSKPFNQSYEMIICLDSSDCVYDSIFLIHMLTSFSNIDFRLYCHPAAQGKLIYSMDDEVMSAFLFPGNKDCIGVGELSNGRTVRQNLNTLIEQENLMFRKSSMLEMIECKDYFQTLISPNTKWVIGHPTELLLPQEVFEELANGEPYEAELRKLYALSQNVLHNKAAKVMIYESTMTNIAIDGVVDFYNRPVKLNPQQILKCLDYYMDLAEMEAEIKLIDGGFSDDFRYITNPCMFLSDLTCYLRLENNRYEDNILLLNYKGIKDLFIRFFDAVWTQRPDVVTSCKEDIREKMKHYRRSAQVLLNS